MAPSPHGAEFPSTRWSLIERARGPDAFLRREAIGSLVTLYWPALRAHLIFRRRLTPETSDDLLQGFAADRILREEFLGHADPEKGRFRSFLLRCLENYVVDHWFRRPEHAGTNADEPLAKVPAPETDEPDPFDVTWARQVLAEALRRMRADCSEEGRLPVWLLFEERVVQPTLADVRPRSYEQLIGRLGFESAEQAANAFVTAKRHFRRVLEGVVAEYVEDEGEVQSEVAALRSILAAAPGTDRFFVAPGASLVVGVVDRKEDCSRRAAAEDGTAESPRTPRADLEAHDSQLSSLSRLFQIDGDRDSAWDADDLPGLLQRLLRLPLAEAMPGFHAPATTVDVASRRFPADLTDSPSPDAAPKRRVAASPPSTPATLAELFTHHTPPLALLEAVKLWSRRATRDDQSILPTDAASLLYFAAIAAARVRLGQWISKLDPSLLKQGIEKFLSQRWVGEPLRRLFQEFRAFAEPPDTR